MDPILSMQESNPVTLEEQATLEIPFQKMSVSLIRDENPVGKAVVLNPHAVKALVENNIKVFIQRGYAAHSVYSDMDYADVGAEFEDDYPILASMSNLVVKFTPFTEEQISMLHPSQIMLSVQQPTQRTASLFQTINQQNVSALALELIRDAKGNAIVDKILQETLSPLALNIALSNFTLPLILDILLNPHFRFALQRTPTLMQSVYCYGGFLCHREWAESLQLPWRDIVSLCWDLN